MEIIRISSKTNAPSIAGAVTAAALKEKKVELHAVGAAAVNQAVKAIAITRQIIEEGEKEVVALPEFMKVTIEEEEKTAIKIIVEIR